MGIRKNQLPISEQVKFGLLSKADQAEILNSKTVDEAVKMLQKKKENVRLDVGEYQPIVQTSGSSVKYKTKNLFTESFDEKDVKDFMSLMEMSEMMEDEVIAGEIKRKADAMIREGKQPLQCLIYATKQDEKNFYNNEKRVTTWAKAIADIVNANTGYIESINHMLVNWGMWKYQITMLIKACNNIKQSEKLDGVIRDLYTNYEDDKVRFNVMKRLLYSDSPSNYQSVFMMLKNIDFVGMESERKYFNTLKKKVEGSTGEQQEQLYAAFRGTQGFSGIKRRRIEGLFVAKEEAGIAKRINESAPDQKETVLKEVHSRIYGTQKEYREIAILSKDITMYREEIQEMFMKKLSTTMVGLEDIKVYGLAIGNLDTDGKAIPFLEEQMSLCVDKGQIVMYSYVLATFSDDYVKRFIKSILEYEGNNSYGLMSSVKNFAFGKAPLIRQHLYPECARIAEENGMDSSEFKNALKNLGEYMQNRSTMVIYDVKFDQLFFDFLGYDRVNFSFDEQKCTIRNATLVLDILENVMDKNNYEGRYMKFMWNLFSRFRNTNVELSKRIESNVKKLTGQGIPSM